MMRIEAEAESVPVMFVISGFGTHLLHCGVAVLGHARLADRGRPAAGRCRQRTHRSDAGVYVWRADTPLGLWLDPRDAATGGPSSARWPSSDGTLAGVAPCLKRLGSDDLDG